MSRNRFVEVEPVRLVLSDEEWVEIKGELNAGEDRKQANLALVPMVVEEVRLDGSIARKLEDRIDWSQYEILRMHLWLTKWHIHDAGGNVPPLTLDAIRALDVETFNEINNRLFEYVLKQAEDKKKERMARIKASQPPEPIAEVVSVS